MTAAPGGPGQPYKSDPSGQGPYQPGQPQPGQYGQPAYQGGAPGYGQYPNATPGTANRGPLMVMGILAILAGAAAAIGSFLDWVSITFPPELAQPGCNTVSVSPMGSASACGQSADLPTGSAIDPWLTLAGGVLAIVGGLLVIAASGARQAGASLAIVGGAVAAGFGIYNMITAGDDIKEGIASASAGAGLDFDANAFDVSISIGLWLVVIGGVVAVIAGIASAAKKA